MFKRLLVVLAVLALVGVAPASACWWPNCDPVEFDLEQSTGGYIYDGDVTIDDDQITLNEGALAAGGQSSSLEIKGYNMYGPIYAGGGAIGGTFLHTQADKNSALAIGATGGVVWGDLYGSDCWWKRNDGIAIEGEGSLLLATAKEGKYGNTFGLFSGDYSFSGEVEGNGSIIGGGYLLGGSYSYIDKHTLLSVSGGVGGVGMCKGYCGIGLD